MNDLPAHHITSLISQEHISARISELANEISHKIPKDVMVIALLRGSFVFAADLIRAFYATGMQPQIDFLTLSSYGSGTKSSGAITLINDIADNVHGRHVLIIDDILESGRTLTYAKEVMESRGAKSVHIAVMLEKPGKLESKVHADFVGFPIEDKFVVGMGLDYANYYRELPYIGVVEFD